MKTSQIYSRDFNIDILRIIALIFIPCLHFFLYTGFYDRPLNEPSMYLTYFFRNLFLLALPVFLLITGYLQGNKKIPVSIKYFSKITKFLIPYILITIVFILVDLIIFDGEYFPEKSLETFTTFPHYAWYLEMYVGLFLLIPFLNMTWSCFTEKKHELVFIGILAGLTLLPSLINSFSLASANWWNGALKDNWSFIPDWWEHTYPITYYFTGAFLKKRKDEFRLKPKHYLLLFAISFVLTNAYHFARDYGNNPSIRGWLYWDSITLFIPAIFLFMFVATLNLEKTPVAIRKITAKISDLCFGAFIASKTADLLTYSFISSRIHSFKDKVLVFPVLIIVVLIISFTISLGADIVYKLLLLIYKKTMARKEVKNV